MKFWILLPLETEQDPLILAPSPRTTTSPACLLPVETFSQRISLIREVRNVETKENSQKGLNNKGNINTVSKHSQGLLVLSLGL